VRFISSREHLKILLKVFGPDLKHLSFEYCSKEIVNLEDLLPCSKLEDLRFRGYLPNTPLNSNAVDFQWEEFLPRLKILESDVCLGRTWSRIFEEKSTLTSIILNCFHIGTEVSINLLNILVKFKVSNTLYPLYLYILS